MHNAPAMSALSVRQLVKVYANGVRALDHLDLDVPEGDFFALLGPNGAGKTTLIGILTSLVTKTSGTVRVFGHDLDTARSTVKQLIGVVPQEINLNQWDSVHNIVVNQAGFYGMPRRRAAQRAQECLEQLRLWERRRETARHLSGGMKRRLMIARALMHGPRLLILDEPTAGVDIEIRRTMWDFLREINAAGTTIILTTHYLEEAENLCRHLAIIDHGRVIEQDRMSSVLGKLGEQRIVLALCEPQTVAPRLEGFGMALLNEHELEVVVPRGRDLNALFAGLSAAGLRVQGVRNKANRLETLFLNLTGRGAPADADVAGAGLP